MAEPQTATVTSKSKPVATASAFEMPKFEMPKFEMPKFEMPKFDMPNMEVPAAFREIAEKGVAQAKESYEKMKTAAEEATEMLEGTYATASKGCSDYGLKLIETAKANSNAAFDLFGEMLTAKSYSEVVELYTAYVRTQFDTVSAQAKELADHAQKVATETVEPIKESLTSAFSKAA
jgi:phasin